MHAKGWGKGWRVGDIQLCILGFGLGKLIKGFGYVGFAVEIFLEVIKVGDLGESSFEFDFRG